MQRPMNYAAPLLILFLSYPVQAATTQEIDDFVLKKIDALPSVLPPTGQTRAMLVEVIDSNTHRAALTIDADRLTVDQVANRVGSRHQRNAVTISCFGKFQSGGRMLANDLFEFGTKNLRPRLKKAGITPASSVHSVCLKMEQGV